MDSTRSVKVQRGENFEWARLRLLDAKIVDELLTPEEVKAVTAHLRMNYPSTVQLLTDNQLYRLVSTTPVSYVETAQQTVGKKLPDDLLYKKGQPSDICTLILSGKVTILVGAEDFRSDLTSWAVLGKSALEQVEFIPDFTAFVSDGPCRCIRFTRKDFAAAVDASAVERTAAETRIQTNASLVRPSDRGAGSSNGETMSMGSDSAAILNRRKKLIAQLFKHENVKLVIPDEVQDNSKEQTVRFKQDKEDGTIDA